MNLTLLANAVRGVITWCKIRISLALPIWGLPPPTHQFLQIIPGSTWTHGSNLPHPSSTPLSSLLWLLKVSLDAARIVTALLQLRYQVRCLGTTAYLPHLPSPLWDEVKSGSLHHVPCRTLPGQHLKQDPFTHKFVTLYYADPAFTILRTF